MNYDLTMSMTGNSFVILLGKEHLGKEHLGKEHKNDISDEVELRTVYSSFSSLKPSLQHALVWYYVRIVAYEFTHSLQYCRCNNSC